MAPLQTAQTIQADYMSLLVTQLRNQNPLEPMDNNQMAMQLTSMSQLQQMEKMSRTFQQVLQSEHMTQGTALIGKLVSFFPSNSNEAVEAVVQALDAGSGEVELVVEGGKILLGDVLTIRDIPDEAPAEND